MLDMELVATSDAVESLDHLLPSLLPFVSDKLLLGSNFSLQNCNNNKNNRAISQLSCGNGRVIRLPLTCCSSVIITSTAILRMPSFVCGLSDFRCDMHIRPNSFSASFISRILILNVDETKQLLNFITQKKSLIYSLLTSLGHC